MRGERGERKRGGREGSTRAARPYSTLSADRHLAEKDASVSQRRRQVGPRDTSHHHRHQSRPAPCATPSGRAVPRPHISHLSSIGGATQKYPPFFLPPRRGDRRPTLYLLHSQLTSALIVLRRSTICFHPFQLVVVYLCYPTPPHHHHHYYHYLLQAHKNAVDCMCVCVCVTVLPRSDALFSHKSQPRST